MRLFQSSQDRDLELLSAYLDDELPTGDREKLERRLAADSELRRTLSGLRRVQTTLGALPRLRLPRSFALKPEMAGRPARRPSLSRFIPALNLATTVAAIMFAVIIGSELATGVRPVAPPAALVGQVQSQSAPAEAPVAPPGSTSLKSTTDTAAVTEPAPAVAQAPCASTQEPLTGGGCSGADSSAGPTGAGGSAVSPFAGIADTPAGGTPPAAGVADAANSSATAAPESAATAAAGTLRVAANGDQTATASPVPDQTVVDNYSVPTNAGPPAFSTVRLAELALGGLLLLLIVASALVRRR